MMVFGIITECDVTDTRYPNGVKGIHCLARGATGRWCHVFNIGPDSPGWEKRIPHVITEESAREQIEAMGDWLDY